jgi:hypothetical protein
MTSENETRERRSRYQDGRIQCPAGRHDRFHGNPKANWRLPRAAAGSGVHY